MREILFRGTATTGFHAGRFVFGYLVKDFWHQGDCGIHPIDKEQGGYIEVDPGTVGQFTGLVDRNGTKIFEGDIVQYGDITGVINCSTGCYCVKTNKPDWKSRNNPAIDIVLNEYPNEVKVVGNIHDNPELIKERES